MVPPIPDQGELFSDLVALLTDHGIPLGAISAEVRPVETTGKGAYCRCFMPGELKLIVSLDDVIKAMGRVPEQALAPERSKAEEVANRLYAGFKKRGQIDPR